MIVLDASVLIAHFAVRDVHAAAAFEILDTEDDLAIHPMTLAEVLVLPARSGRDDFVLSRIDAIGIGQFDPPQDEPARIARLRASAGLKLPDCCVLASALHTGAALATFDAQLASAARSAGVEVVGAPAMS